jgi:hypothetical protein
MVANEKSKRRMLSILSFLFGFNVSHKIGFFDCSEEAAEVIAFSVRDREKVKALQIEVA